MARQAVELALQLSCFCSQLLPGRQSRAAGDIAAPLQGPPWHWWVPLAPPAPGNSFRRGPTLVQNSAQGGKLFDLWSLQGLPVPQTGPRAQDSRTSLAEGSLCCALLGPLRSRSVLGPSAPDCVSGAGTRESPAASFLSPPLSNTSTNPSSLPWPSKPLIPSSQLPGAQPSLTLCPAGLHARGSLNGGQEGAVSCSDALYVCPLPSSPTGPPLLSPHCPGWGSRPPHHLSLAQELHCGRTRSGCS